MTKDPHWLLQFSFPSGLVMYLGIINDHVFLVEEKRKAKSFLTRVEAETYLYDLREKNPQSASLRRVKIVSNGYS